MQLSAKRKKLITLPLKVFAFTFTILSGVYYIMPESQQYIKTENNLQYRDVVEGSGTSPKNGQMVTVHYTGKLENGTVFDSSVTRGTPFTYQIGVGQVIAGWDEGVATMKVGGKRELVIPPELGYGSQAVGGKIPANSTLIFEVELLGVK